MPNARDMVQCTVGEYCESPIVPCTNFLQLLNLTVHLMHCSVRTATSLEMQSRLAPYYQKGTFCDGRYVCSWWSSPQILF